METNRRKRLLGVLLPFLLLVLGCCSLGYFVGSRGRSYPQLGPITRIRVDPNATDRRSYVIDDPVEVKQIVDFVDRQRHGWGAWGSGWAGIPVGQINVEFFNGDEFRGSFGIGPGFFECQREGDFDSKHCSRSSEIEFLKLIGLPDYDLHK